MFHKRALLLNHRGEDATASQLAVQGEQPPFGTKLWKKKNQNHASLYPTPSAFHCDLEFWLHHTLIFIMAGRMAILRQHVRLKQGLD